MTEWLHFHFSLSRIGEGNGNPLQCSCLENPGDGGAWWAAVYGVTQSRTWLKWRSSSSSSSKLFKYIVSWVFFSFFWFMPCSKWDLSSPTRDWTHTLCTGVLTTVLPGKSLFYGFLFKPSVKRWPVYRGMIIYFIHVFSPMVTLSTIIINYFYVSQLKEHAWS